MRYAVATTAVLFILVLIAALNVLIPMLTDRFLQVLP